MNDNVLDLVVVGGGPIGIEAGIRGLREGWTVRVLERGVTGSHLLQWHGLRMFTPFSMNHSSVARQWAMEHGVVRPDSNRFMSGPEYVQSWLRPLVDKTPLSDRVSENTEVQAISRNGLLKGDEIGSERRTESPFRVRVWKEGKPEIVLARKLLDATGTFGQPNPVGQGGVPAPGENKFDQLVHHHFPTDEKICNWGGERILLVGGGYSAATNLLRLKSLQNSHPNTKLFWLIRSRGDPPIDSIENDPLDRRVELTKSANQFASTGDVQLLRGNEIERIAAHERHRLRITLSNGQDLEMDRIIANTGFRPDRSLYRELQVHECYGTEGPINLAANLMEQNEEDCLDVDPGGADRLETPEPDFFIVGSKSYGRNSMFLMETGFQQLDLLFDEKLTRSP